jgi:hypothetical protein
MVSLRIRNKDHLKKFILPIFDKYAMFYNKQYDFLRFKEALLSGIVYYDDLVPYSRSIVPLNTVETIANASYFSALLVGFIEAEGCFSTYKNNDSYQIASFDISQTYGDIIISAIKKNIYLLLLLYI